MKTKNNSFRGYPETKKTLNGNAKEKLKGVINGNIKQIKEALTKQDSLKEWKKFKEEGNLYQTIADAVYSYLNAPDYYVNNYGDKCYGGVGSSRDRVGRIEDEKLSKLLESTVREGELIDLANNFENARGLIRNIYKRIKLAIQKNNEKYANAYYLEEIRYSESKDNNRTISGKELMKKTNLEGEGTSLHTKPSKPLPKKKQNQILQD